MKKLIISLLMVLAAVFCLRAGTLGDTFNNKIRPSAAMVQNIPDSDLGEGLTAATAAMLDAAAMELALAAVPADFKAVLDVNQNGSIVKAYMVEAGNESEGLLFVSGGDQNVVVYAQGSAEAIASMFQQ